MQKWYIEETRNNNKTTDGYRKILLSECVCMCVHAYYRRGEHEKRRDLIHNMAAPCMAAYITASISAKLQCNFLTLHFSSQSITQTTPHGYFWWDSEPGRGNESEQQKGCLWSNRFSSPLLINFQLDCLASSIISIKFPWIKPANETLSSSCLSNTKFQISFCF